jgi:hypothetical protein
MEKWRKTGGLCLVTRYLNVIYGRDETLESDLRMTHKYERRRFITGRKKFNRLARNEKAPAQSMG